ncbi:DUF418 domain-containing protein [Saxibacter everestensis]|uniref:DUF418 domain-containing protein n=1 Tax=Saxibacter everestensis TaxID=2909229 RepID=A0ABY8QTL1_9MICO|nr:DUF418 domain-containing protein [Brevibacteriaceae bacterium ZFBP1038]
MTIAHQTPEVTSGATSPARIVTLDVLRGFALCGILLANIGQITLMGIDVAEYEPQAPSRWLGLLVDERFFPIFSLLFGVGFAMILDSAKRRGVSPRLVLLRRLLMLGVLGVAHHLLQPGEALLPYSIVGIVVLLPASWLPRIWILLAGAGLLIASVVAGGGLISIPGLFLLGLAIQRYGVIGRITGNRRLAATCAVISLAISVPLFLGQATAENLGNETLAGAAGLAIALTYCLLIALLMHTPVAAFLTRALAPLGRLALTNYIAATLLVLLSTTFIDYRNSYPWGAYFGTAAVIIVVQWAFSSIWLRFFRYGPLEWAWRTVTWCRLVPIRNPASA